MFSIRNNNNSNSNNVIMGFSRTRPYSNVNRNEVAIPVPEVIQPSDADKMKWGPPTWFMLHTMAEKVDAERFGEIKPGLLTVINMIISNLPCPICSEHGKQFLNSVNFNNIQTKEDLKHLLFDFHNLVNSRKKYAIFTYEELNEKYSKAITVNVMQNFMIQFTKKSGSIRLIADDLHRQRMVSTIKTFLNTNIRLFAQ